MAVSINGGTGVTIGSGAAYTFGDASTQTSAADPADFGFKNRIINGAMVIDQRNAGASVTPTNGAYTLDRWSAILTQASKYTVQQNAGSVTPPTGFKNYLGVTSSSAYSVLTGDLFAVRQLVEGFNVADLGWGAAGAATVTLSFWVRSSLGPGTFGGSLINSAANRFYPFTYTISAANTWEQKSVTIAGDTSGTWITDNGIGLGVYFGLGGGATYSGTAGAWTGTGTPYTATGAVSVVGASGATFYITGVQLEKNTGATGFDVRPYGTELALCQRYFYKATSRPMSIYNGPSYGYNCIMPLPVTMRSSPTLDSGGTWTVSGGSAGTVALGSGTGNAASPDSVQLYNSSSNWTTNVALAITAGFSAEL